MWVAFAGGLSLSVTASHAQTPPAGMRMAQAALPVAAETSVPRRKPSTRLRVYPNYEPGPEGVYPRYYPGRNAVRECSVNYVQEYRPSGTVIVPRMSCVWRPG